MGSVRDNTVQLTFILSGTEDSRVSDLHDRKLTDNKFGSTALQESIQFFPLFVILSDGGFRHFLFARS
jgi:hypothetical protein